MNACIFPGTQYVEALQTPKEAPLLTPFFQMTTTSLPVPFEPDTGISMQNSLFPVWLSLDMAYPDSACINKRAALFVHLQARTQEPRTQN